jgi:drug/metabolite transporter (DMT)-like permease
VTVNGVSRGALVAGVGWALAAGLCWGLAFIAPLALPGFDAVEITAGRYVAYGFVSLAVLIVATSRANVAGLNDPRLWLQSFVLTLFGNLIYFVCLTAGIRRANAPVATLIIGTLPVLIPVAANLVERTFAWSRMIVPAALMLAGVYAVHVGERSSVGADVGDAYASGIALIVAALIAWTTYGVANARLVARRPDVSAATWASLQGITLLPLAGLMLASSPMTDGRNWMAFAFVSLALGIVASWIAMWCWNRAGGLLPAALAGQLIVFETLAGLLYAYVWKMEPPPLLVVAGAVLLLAGILVGVRRIR